jgi:formylglycine-generating enzyme required for sulfatase activity
MSQPLITSNGREMKMSFKKCLGYLLSIMLTGYSCQTGTKNIDNKKYQDSMISCHNNIPSRLGNVKNDSTEKLRSSATLQDHSGMVLIKGGDFMMGAADREGRNDEYPLHAVAVKDFWMDITEVTNRQFKQFVTATRYVTTAEKAIDWNEMKKQLPAGTPKPPDDQLLPASLVFRKNEQANNLTDFSQWWVWMSGANWKHPHGPGSDIIGKDDYPVVQVSWDDAVAYCKWLGKRLCTEAEWEYAARGGLINKKYPWGDEDPVLLRPKANTWQGKFPAINTNWDHFENAAPVKSFQSNAYGLFDMAGNVWEWCSDWYHESYYPLLEGKKTFNPTGPLISLDSEEPSIPKRVVRGGSFLCNASYCKGYRVSARMKTSPDTGLEHTGFRCVAD